MKTRYLFPYSWRKPGLILILFGIIAAIINACYTNQLISWQAGHPLFLGTNAAVLAQIVVNDMLMLAVILGLLFIGFSKEPIEDEQVAQLRLESLQWAIYFNYGILIICILFVNGIDFFNVMVYQIMTPLLFFVVRFRWMMYKINCATREEVETL